jgi:hypothetical protein
MFNHVQPFLGLCHWSSWNSCSCWARASETQGQVRGSLAPRKALRDVRCIGETRASCVVGMVDRNLPWFVCFWTCKNVYSFLFSCIKTHVTCSFFNHLFTLLFFTCKKTIYQLNIYRKPWFWLPHVDVWCNFPLNHHLEINCVLKPGLVYTQKVGYYGYYYQNTLKEQQTMMNGMINGMSTKCLQHLVDRHEQLIHQTMLSWKNIGICRKDCPDKIRQVTLFDSP